MRVRYVAILACLVLNYSCQEKKNTDKRLTICFTGDVLLDRGVRKQIERKASADFLFEDVAPLFKASDATVINLECPITHRATPINKRFIFRGEPEWLPALRNGGVTHAALANNHTMDQGRSGLTATYHHLADVGIHSVGYGENQALSCEPVLISKDSIKVAIFNSVQLPLENWVYLEDKPGICQSSIGSLSASIMSLKRAEPDIHIVVVLHWGAEYQLDPAMVQRKDAYTLIDAGADVIIGHHPHVIQQEEIYKGKPIFYSLGNFVFDQSRSPMDKSIIVRLLFDKKNIVFEKYPVTIKNCKPCM